MVVKYRIVLRIVKDSLNMYRYISGIAVVMEDASCVIVSRSVFRAQKAVDTFKHTLVHLLYYTLCNEHFALTKTHWTLSMQASTQSCSASGKLLCLTLYLKYSHAHCVAWT